MSNWWDKVRLGTMIAGLVIGGVVARPAVAVCPGDCNGDGTADAASLTKIISIMVLCPGEPAAGCASVPGDDKQCTAADTNGNGSISADEMTTVISNIIKYETGCPPPGVATPTVPPAPATATKPPTVAVPTATVPPVATATVPAVPTATQPAATPTPPPAATPTPTTATGPGLGERVFTINATTGSKAVSKLYTSVLSGLSVVAPPGITGSVTLVAGPKAADGTAPLTLAQDTIIAIPLIQNAGIVCMKLFKDGTHGTLDCDGGLPANVSVTVDSHGAGANGETVWETSGSGPAGSAVIDVMQTGMNVPLPATVADCQTASYAAPSRITYTTGTVSTTVLNPLPGSPGVSGDKITVTPRTGTPFDCSVWTQTDSAGALVTVLLGLDTVTPGATAPVDTVNTMVITDK